MNKESKKKWVEALRSGKYTQGHACLRRTRSQNTMEHCCLGVLAEITGGFEEATARNLSSDATCPQVSFLGETRASLCELDISDQSRLAAMNDRGKPFTDIADYIERTL